MSKLDLLLYFVTDPTMVPEGSTFVKQIERAVENGATIVQLREKKTSTLDFINKAKEVLEILRPKNIPLIINDRVDVALAVDADGVHVGQDDMPASLVRKLIGPDKILGVSCGNPKETQQVVDEQVADYVGLGTLYPTNTKDVKNVCGPIGIRRLLEVLRDQKNDKRHVQSVAIGGINSTNATKVVYQCSVPGCHIDGVAVVSCIMAAPDAAEATRNLKAQLEATVPWIKGVQAESTAQSEKPWDQVRKAKPLVHHITNNVVKNFSANVTLAIGASPVMSELAEEFCEFASLPSPVGLLMNLGSPTPELLQVFLEGLRRYNDAGKPVLFDPVAAGATEARLSACRVLLNAGHFSVIKGNVGEIAALASLTKSTGSLKEKLMQGVDSIATFDEEKIVSFGKIVATEFQTIVVVTGKDDYVIDGTFSRLQQEVPVEKILGGHELMDCITGSGCSLGSVIAAFLAAKADGSTGEQYSSRAAVSAAVRLYSDAGLEAAKSAQHPGTFMVKFLDALLEVSTK